VSQLPKRHASLRTGDRQSPQKIRLYQFISVVLCSLLDFLMLEAGTDRLSQNVGVELPLRAANQLRRV